MAHQLRPTAAAAAAAAAADMDLVVTATLAAGLVHGGELEATNPQTSPSGPHHLPRDYSLLLCFHYRWWFTNKGTRRYLDVNVLRWRGQPPSTFFNGTA